MVKFIQILSLSIMMFVIHSCKDREYTYVIKNFEGAELKSSSLHADDYIQNRRIFYFHEKSTADVKIILDQIFKDEGLIIVADWIFISKDGDSKILLSQDNVDVYVTVLNAENGTDAIISEVQR